MVGMFTGKNVSRYRIDFFDISKYQTFEVSHRPCFPVHPHMFYCTDTAVSTYVSHIKIISITSSFLSVYTSSISIFDVSNTERCALVVHTWYALVPCFLLGGCHYDWTYTHCTSDDVRSARQGESGVRNSVGPKHNGLN